MSTLEDLISEVTVGHKCHMNMTEKVKGKGGVVPFILLTKHHATKAYWGSGGIAPLILRQSVLDGGEW